MPSRSLIAHESRAKPARHWSRLSDTELLQLRFCDLKLKLERSAPKRGLRRLDAELKRRHIHFMPHAWLAEEWFSPDGVPGIAVPFYLAHPRLRKLERRMMGQVEGGNRDVMMRILRHEAGHAIDTAWRLRRRARWREIFGPASLPYPDSYRARAGSRRYVHHLDDWYAQSHPTEDFAETFAVWLKPNSDWRRSYAQWPARRKLEYVGQLMQQLRDARPLVCNRRVVEPLRGNRRTLAQHYAERLARRTHRPHSDTDDLLAQAKQAARLGPQGRRRCTDSLLEQVFTARPRRRSNAAASVFLRAHRARLIAEVLRVTGATRYSVLQVLRIAITRAAALRLHLRASQRAALPHARWLLKRMLRDLGHGATPTLSL
jgi:hypothetical protein